MDAKDRIIVALDNMSKEQALALMATLAQFVGMFKVGLEMITKGAHVDLIREGRVMGAGMFLDGKFKDIPNTMAQAAKAASELGVKFFNVHASAGPAGMKAAVENRGSAGVLAVTVLTSMDEEACYNVYGDFVSPKVLKFAQRAHEAGVSGLICSPKDLENLRGGAGLQGMLKVTPGIRPVWAAVGDQKRITTPADAIRAGADFLVIGRPITDPPENIGAPIEAAKLIAAEMEQALAEREKVAG